MEEAKYIEIGEHSFYLPEQPPKKDILFHNEKKKDQYWDRSKVISDIPKIFFDWNKDVIEDSEYTTYEGKRLKSLSIKDTDSLIFYRDREIKRMKEGIWFFNDGEPTYITGGHYFALTWGAMLDSLNDVEERSIFGKYMQFQRNYCYFIEICKHSVHCQGGNVIKPKKTGITMLQALLMLNDCLTNRRSFYRIMSTKEDVAKKINFKYISYAIDNLPSILTPEHRKNLGAVYFENTDTASTRRGKKSDIAFLDSAIETVATVDNGFDSGKNKIAWVDEESKIKEGAYPEPLHNTTLPTVLQGLLKIGYVIYTHYVSEKNDKSFKQAKKIYYESKLSTIIPETNKTKSKLICYAMTVLDGVFGACDKYGKPELDKIWNEINSEHESKKDDPAALRAYRRQMPTCEADMWQESAGEWAVFDGLRLGERLQQLTEDRSRGILPYFTFNFAWTSPPQIDEIREIYNFPGNPMIQRVTDDDIRAKKQPGVFKWYRPEWTPQEFIQKHVNKIDKDKRGKMKPKADCPFYMSIDPTQYSAAKDVATGSLNAMQIFLLPNAELDGFVNKRCTNKRLMVEYLHRADNPKDTLMHAVQAILYFGCYVLIECNANWLATRLKEWGFENFLIQVNKETKVLEPYNEFVEQQPFTSQKSEKGTVDTISDYVSAGMVHLNDYSSIDNIEFLDSEEVIRQLIDFEPDDTRRFDAAVAYLIGLLGINTFLGWKQRSMKARVSPNGNMRVMAGKMLN